MYILTKMLGGECKNIALQKLSINKKYRVSVETLDIERGIRSEDVIERSIVRIPMYQTLNTTKIDTNAKNVAMIANEIKQL